MKIIYNKYMPFKGFCAINLFGVIFARKEAAPLSFTTINHERIHTAQMKELLYVGFYVLYLLEWVYRLCTGKNAYRRISFEKEAYNHENDLLYLRQRKQFAQWRKEERK